MRLKLVAATFAALGTLAVMAAPVQAQSSERRVTSNARGHTVFTSRDEDGRTRTRIIIQRRSYLDPGTQVLPGSRHDREYASSPGQRASSVLDNTAFGGNQTALPGALEPGFGKNGPFLRF
ncbi:MAG: hypothetical protein Q8M24_19495 [Pseudolabrys sp.]|nr:hypothetical protein [Pseudolabrys sp.]MDP2297634.1 hypothetical protein [Pseudolabrys sp.]